VQLPSVESEWSIGLSLLTIHFGGVSKPTINQRWFQWDDPISWDDAITGVVGSRSTVYHPGRNVRLTAYGPEGRDFARGTLDNDEPTWPDLNSQA
jgi:hypothetical protein